MHQRSPLCDQDFRMDINLSRSDATFDFHAHDEYEIYYFCSGEVQYYIEEQCYSMVAGDMLVIPPGKMHRLVTLDEHVPYGRIVIYLSESYCKRLIRRVEDHFIFRGVDECRLSVEDKDNKMYDLLRSFLNMEVGDAGLLQRDATVTLLLIKLDQLIKTSLAVQGEEHHLTSVINYLNANFTRDISLEEIAERFFVSKYHLLRQFKALTNSTVHQYLLKKRIMLAKALLRQGVSPSETAERCGFSTYSGFYQAFLKATEVSPFAFQKSNQI